MFTSFTPFPVKQSSTPLHPTLNFLQTKQCPSQTTNLVLIPLHLVPTFVPQVQQMYFLLHDWLLLCSSENYYSHEAWWGFVVKVVTIVRNLTVGFFFLFSPTTLIHTLNQTYYKSRGTTKLFLLEFLHSELKFLNILLLIFLNSQMWFWWEKLLKTSLSWNENLLLQMSHVRPYILLSFGFEIQIYHSFLLI